MEPKIKTAKELKIKAVEQAEAIDSAENNDDYGMKKLAQLSANTIPMSKKQVKARAKAKKAKAARNINHKNSK